MASFNNTIITKKGHALIAKIVAGTATPNFTKIRTSDHQYPSGTNFEELTSLSGIKQTVDVASVTKVSPAKIRVSGVFTNAALETGYYVRNIGLYAVDPQEGEILYSITTAIEADWMPPQGGISASSILVDIETVVGNADNVNITVNPNATATVEMVNNLAAEIADVKGFIGYTENDIVGVEADFVNSKFTRLAGAINRTPGAGFDDIKAFGGRKRCILTDDGVVLAYYGEPGYVETGKLTQAITIGEEENAVTYPVDTPVQVMVEQPKFYYKVVPLQLEPITDGIGYHLRKARYYVSDTPKVGFKVHPAFVRNGVEVDKIYLSAYEGSIYDESAGTYLLADEQIADFNADKLSSIAYAKPASGLEQTLTRANTRKLANNRGNGWQISDVLSVSVTQILFIIEYASFNTQANIGLGVVNKADGEGNESEITGATTNLGNASGMADGTNGLVSVTYRGEENFWGNIWKWIDGLNIECKGIHQAYWADHDFQDNIKTSPYKNCGFTLAKSNGYVSAFGYSEDCDFLFLPSETVGNSSLPVGDNFWQNHTYDGFMVSYLGGRWNNGSNAGGFRWNVNHWSGNRNRNIGGRLLYVPQG